MTTIYKNDIEWENSKGLTVGVRVELTALSSYYDGITTNHGTSLTVSPLLEGKVIGLGSIADAPKNNMGIVKVCGQIGMSAENYSRVAAAIKAAKGTPEFKADAAQRAASAAVDDAYDMQYAKTARILNACR